MESTTTQETVVPETYPLLGIRIQSTFIDGIFLIVMLFLISSILDHFENVPDSVRIILFVLLFLIYDPLCTSLGCTLGNYMKDIRVRRLMDTNKRINFFRALIRYITKSSLGFISFFTINSNYERRAIHDFISGSVVVNKQ